MAISTRLKISMSKTLRAMIKRLFGYQRQESGSLSLEAAMILPLTLLVLACLVLCVNLANYQQRWHTAGINACNELETIAAAIGSFDQTKLNSQLMEKIQVKLPQELGKRILDFKTGMLSANYLLQRQKQLFNQSNQPNLSLNPRLLKRARAKVKIDEAKHCLYYQVTVRFNVLLGEFPYEFRLIVPLWNRFPFSDYHLSAKADSSENQETVWQKSNFERGDYFQKQYGANLPKQYPVINAFNQGVATRIKSIDLTNPRLQDHFYLEKRVNELAAPLANFSGYQSASGRWPSINNNEIKARQLILIVPENAPQEIVSAMQTMLAKYPNISYEIKYDQISNRYQEKADNEDNLDNQNSPKN